MKAKPKVFPELIFKFIVLVLGLVIIIASIGYGLGTIKQPGTGMFTLILGVLILVSGAIHLFSNGKSEDNEPLFQNATEIRKFIFTSLILILWIVGLSYMGFVVMTLLVTLIMSKVVGLEGWLKPIILSFLTSSFIYLLFDYWLYIDLPKGILG